MSFRQLDLYKDSKHICRPIASLRLSPDAITGRYGITFIDERDDLDFLMAAMIVSASGRRFGLVFYLNAPEPRGTNILVDERSKDFSGDLADFNAILSILPEDYLWIHPDA